MNRAEMIDRLREERRNWDLLIIGGGATGVACALDAASRGYRTALVEQHDFGKGTSSRSTKLIHGGVRYLEQGNVTLVMEALKERGILRENAPHLVSDLAFIVPNYEWWEAPFYGVGLRLYDLLAGKYGFGKSRLLSREETLERLPNLKPEGLRGGVIYYDGQFDDARLLIHMARTAVEQGAALANYCRVTALVKDGAGMVCGAVVLDEESGEEIELRAKAVINATGCFSDAVRRMGDAEARPMIAPSQGVHLVFDSSFLRGDAAILAPRTRDGRVMFAIPWHGHALVGTTDTALDEVSLEPLPLQEEIELILATASDYLDRAPSRADILSAWAGIRPLVRSAEGASTASLSRDHSIHIDRNGLITIAGGKWTTCRRMAEDCIDQASLLAGLDERPCVTRHLRIHGYHHHAGQFGHLGVYGSDAIAIREMVRLHPERGRPLAEALPYLEAEAVWAARWEMARRVEDVLARRTRALQLNARAAMEAAPKAAEILARELGRDAAWAAAETEAFRRLAARYLPDGV
jgi:glycerol-3-phosphate dehydrogenase